MKSLLNVCNNLYNYISNKLNELAWMNFEPDYAGWNGYLTIE